LNWFLIPKFGINGAALASSIGYSVAGIVLLLFLLRESKMNWRDFIIPRWRELIGHFEWIRTEGIRLHRTI
jgi:Na+-driven multidrug efflux pump